MKRILFLSTFFVEGIKKLVNDALAKAGRK